MEHCNAALSVIGASTKTIIGPIYQYIYEYYEVPFVIGFNRIGSPTNVGGMMILENSLMAKITKSAKNEMNVKVNNEYTVEGRKYKVTHIDSVQTGLLLVQMDFTVIA